MKDSLEKRLRMRLRDNKPKALDREIEHLAFAAIKRMDQIYTGQKSHYAVRAARGDADPQKSDPLDIDGFLTSTGRFVSRVEARIIGVMSGQLSRGWLATGRKLLSSDLW